MRGQGLPGTVRAKLSRQMGEMRKVLCGPDGRFRRRRNGRDEGENCDDISLSATAPRFSGRLSNTSSVRKIMSSCLLHWLKYFGRVPAGPKDKDGSSGVTRQARLASWERPPRACRARFSWCLERPQRYLSPAPPPTLAHRHTVPQQFQLRHVRGHVRGSPCCLSVPPSERICFCCQRCLIFWPGIQR